MHDQVVAALNRMMVGFSAHQWVKYRPYLRDPDNRHNYCLMGMTAMVCGGPIPTPIDQHRPSSLLDIVEFLKTDEIANAVVGALWRKAGQPHATDCIENQDIHPCVIMMTWNDTAMRNKEQVVEHIRATKTFLMQQPVIA